MFLIFFLCVYKEGGASEFKGGAAMAGEFKHLVLVKFKEGAAVGEILKGMENLVSEVEAVKSFEW